MSSQKDAGFSEEIVDRVAQILGVKPSDKFTKPDGSVIASKEEIQKRLNFIKMFFGNPESFDRWVPPSKMKILFKGQHKKISDALDVLRSLNDPVIGSTEISKQPNLARMWLYEASEVSPDLSAGLVGYDVATFDMSFSTAIESLEKVEGYFSSVLNRAESSVKGRGETKPENAYADYLLGSLCQLYKDITGEIPAASVDDINGTVRGRIVKFLEVVLKELPYPNKTTPTALEKKLRVLKSQKIYAYLWEDAKK